MRPASWGRDFVGHIFREGNDRADALTHDAREGRCHHSLRLMSSTPGFERDYYEVVALRGKFDGGVSLEGVGIGWWLQAGLIYNPDLSSSCADTHYTHVSKRARVDSSSSPLASSILWRNVGECASLLCASSTITDAELTALEGLLEAAELFIQDCSVGQRLGRLPGACSEPSPKKNDG